MNAMNALQKIRLPIAAPHYVRVEPVTPPAADATRKYARLHLCIACRSEPSPATLSPHWAEFRLSWHGKNRVLTTTACERSLVSEIARICNTQRAEHATPTVRP